MFCKFIYFYSLWDYVNFSDLNQVLKYVPVMARPLVLGRTDHPTIWTPVYADVTDPKMTDWLWEQRESKEQKDLILRHKYRIYNMEEQDRRYVKKQKRHDQTSGLQKYKLMTSVSMPVFDRRENAVRFPIIRYIVWYRTTSKIGWWKSDDCTLIHCQ